MAINRAPAPDLSDPAISRMAAAAEAHRLDLDGMPNQAGDSFLRYYPPGPGNSYLGGGNTQGFLRYLSRDPATPLQCDCPGGFSLTLDRATSAPNAQIAVSFLSPSPYRANWLVMFPGDTIHVPGGFERFWIYNADYIDRLTTSAVRTPTGFVSFQIGTRRNGNPPHQSAVMPPFSYIYTGFLDSVGASSIYLPAGRCRRFGLTFVQTDATGVEVVSAAAMHFEASWLAPFVSAANPGILVAGCVDVDAEFFDGFATTGGDILGYVATSDGSTATASLSIPVPFGTIMRLQNLNALDLTSAGVVAFSNLAVLVQGW